MQPGNLLCGSFRYQGTCRHRHRLPAITPLLAFLVEGEGRAHISCIHLRQAFSQVRPVQQPLILQPVPEIFPKVPILAGRPQVAEEAQDRMQSLRVEQQARPYRPRGKKAVFHPGADGALTQHTRLRALTSWLRAERVASLDALPAEQASGAGVDRLTRGPLTAMIAAVRRARVTPESEYAKDRWDMAALGMTGYVDFGGISQPWLRETAKRWVRHAAPQRRGERAGNNLRSQVLYLDLLSQSLRARADRGNDPAGLGRADIEFFLARAARKEHLGEISAHKRRQVIITAGSVLKRGRLLGLTRPGEPMHGVADDFALIRGDLPGRPERSEAGRDLPPEVMRQLCAHLDWLDGHLEREMRVGIELLMDTGRRPDEACELAYDCLAFDNDGKPVLIYGNSKENRPQRQLPLHQATADLIRAQQARVRSRYPHTPAAELKLLPSVIRNPRGRKAISADSLGENNRAWVDAMPEIKLDDGTAFDKSKIFLYAYRHTYAQRHADAGVAVDVLAMLLDHDTLEATRGQSGSSRPGCARQSTQWPGFSSTATATGPGSRPGSSSTPSAPARPSARSRWRSAAAPSRPTSPQEAASARCGSAAWAASTSARTCPTCPSCAATSTTCCGPGNGCRRWPPPTTGPSARRCPPRRRSPACGGSSAGSPRTSNLSRPRSKPRSTTPSPRSARPARRSSASPGPPAPPRRPAGAPGMTGSATAAARMTKGRQADSGRRRERVLNTLAEMARSGEAVTVSALAKRAGVDRSFLYRHPDLLAQAHASAVQPPPGGATAPSRASLQADLLAANDRLPAAVETRSGCWSTASAPSWPVTAARRRSK